MTLAQLATQLQQLLLEHPDTAGLPVDVAPHGNQPYQRLVNVFVGYQTIVLEARH